MAVTLSTFTSPRRFTPDRSPDGNTFDRKSNNLPDAPKSCDLESLLMISLQSLRITRPLLFAPGIIKYLRKVSSSCTRYSIMSGNFHAGSVSAHSSIKLSGVKGSHMSNRQIKVYLVPEPTVWAARECKVNEFGQRRWGVDEAVQGTAKGNLKQSFVTLPEARCKTKH